VPAFASAQYWAILDEPGKRRLFVSGSDWADADTVERVLLGDRTVAKKAESLDALTRKRGCRRAQLPARTALDLQETCTSASQRQTDARAVAITLDVVH
jgi:hypothetical protein